MQIAISLVNLEISLISALKRPQRFLKTFDTIAPKMAAETTGQLSSSQVFAFYFGDCT